MFSLLSFLSSSSLLFTSPPYHILPCLIKSYLILSYLTLSYLISSYLIFPYHIISSLLIISVQILLSSFIEWAAQLGQVRQKLLLAHMIRWHNCIVLCCSIPRLLSLSHTHTHTHTHIHTKARTHKRIHIRSLSRSLSHSHLFILLIYLPYNALPEIFSLPFSTCIPHPSFQLFYPLLSFPLYSSILFSPRLSTLLFCSLQSSFISSHLFSPHLFPLFLRSQWGCFAIHNRRRKIVRTFFIRSRCTTYTEI